MSRRRLAVLLAGVIFMVAAFGLVIQMFVPPGSHQARVAQVLYLLDPVVTSVLGGYLAAVRPKHPAGWLALLIAGAGALDSVAKAAINLKVGSTEAGSVRSWGAWIDNWVWVFLFGGVSFLLLLFPTGTLPSPRWRWIARVMAGLVVTEGVLCALVDTSLDTPGVQSIAPGVVPDAVAGTGFLGLLFALIVGIVSLFVRRRAFRRSGDLVGQAQLRWLLLASSVVLGVFLVGLVIDRTTTSTDLLAKVWDVVSQLAFFGFPVSIGIAVSRHGLFEIDRVISRTVSYLAVTGLLLGAYVGIIAALTAFLPTNVNSVVVAAATLAIAALFVPVRRAVQRRVDHRFNRSRYDRAALVERFADQLRRDVTHGSDGTDLLAVVHRALEPTHAGLWLAKT